MVTGKSVLAPTKLNSLLFLARPGTASNNLLKLYNRDFPRITSTYSTSLVLSVSGVLFLANDPSLTQFGSETNLSRIRSKFYTYRLSFYNKVDLKRLLLRRPSFTKLILSFQDVDSLTNLDSTLLASRKVSSWSTFREPLLLSSYFVGRAFDLSRYNLQHFYTRDLENSDFGRELLIRRVKFKPGYQRI